MNATTDSQWLGTAFPLFLTLVLAPVSGEDIVRADDHLANALASEQLDWPTYRHDVQRSGFSAEGIDAAMLGIGWQWQSAHPPQPAWYGPAKRDAYANVPTLPSMRGFDPVFHAVAVGQSVFFGSTADDTVYCLDASSGKERWSYVTDGPVRVSPTYCDGQVYVGSDDGYVYCLSAQDGSLVWRFSPAPDAKRILNNGRLISLLPCRTGVVVDGDVAYFANSMLPWEPSYLCAVDARSGEPTGERRYVQRLDAVTMEGPLAASSTLLISPQGRVAPQLFRRTDGRTLGSLKGSGGGSIVVLSPDSRIFHGPAATSSRNGGINATSPRTLEKIASYGVGKDIVIAGNRAFMLTRDSLVASDWVEKKDLWTTPCQQTLALIVAGDTVFAGGEDEVAAYSARDGRLVWEHPVTGKAYGLAAARGRLLVSTDVGTIYAFEPGNSTWKLDARPTTHGSETGEIDELEDIQPVPDVRDEHLLGRWVFQRDTIKGNSLKDLTGNHDAKVAGQISLKRVGKYQALALDGISQSVVVHEDHNRAKLPRREITAEAWVRVDKPLAWGGIIGAFQDDGALERGWLLGFRENRFCFAVKAADGPDALTYLTAEADFVLGGWYHVMGTFDGREQRLYINGELAAKDAGQQGDIKYPEKTFYEIGAYHDSNEYFRLQGMLHEVCVYDRALDQAEALAHYESRRTDFPRPALPPPPKKYVPPATGPWLQFTEPGTAVVRWHTAQPSPTALKYWRDGEFERKPIADANPKTEHEVTLTGLKRNRVYRYVIEQLVDERTEATQEYECDTLFNYVLPPVPTGPSPYGTNTSVDYGRAAAHILAETGITKGLCLVVGCGDGRLAFELAKRSQLRVIGLDDDEGKVAAAREALRQAKLYGGRVFVHFVEDYAKTELPGEIANLIVSDSLLATGQFPGTATELQRLLKPGGGVALLGQLSGDRTVGGLEEPLRGDRVAFTIRESDNGRWALLRRDRFPGAGDWSHLYGRADNSAYGGERLGGVSRAEQLQVQWVGRPGPRYQVDRNGRKPSPLSTNGRIFLQGEQRIVAVDTANGSVLWSVELPGLARFNMPRDCSNWCADQDNVYAAIRDKCWRIDAPSGYIVRRYDVVAPDKRRYDWGYVSIQESIVVGSAVPEGTSWTRFTGGEGWYDAKSGPQTAKICSENLFAVDKESGQPVWRYGGGPIINPTITIADGRVYFVESRSAEVRALPTRRIDSPKMWDDLVLVSLDLATGNQAWEQSIDPAAGTVTFYLAYGDRKLVLVSSADNKYFTYVYRADNGQNLWERSLPWLSDNHGGHMSRPAIVDGTLYVRPHTMRLDDGEVLSAKMPGGGCGTYACTDGALFFRAGTVTLWDRRDSTVSTWSRLRPDCWLSTIPADGLLLSPEGGGGCSCGSWMETSIVFKPVTQ